MSKSKIPILFIVGDFCQAGAERYAYEIDTIINKEKFDISILSISALDFYKTRGNYYYEKHKALRTKIYFLNEVNIPYQPTLGERIKQKFFHISIPSDNQSFHDFIDRFKAIFFIGEYLYPVLQNKLTQSQRSNCLISVHNSKFQNANNYIKFNKSEYYHFVTSFKEQDLSWELSEFGSYTHTFFPLSFNVTDKNMKWKFPNATKKKIGIFTRLTHSKPLKPFVYAFNSLVQSNPDLELHLFGGMDPVTPGNDHQYIELLNLTEKVIYRGHQEDIVATALNEDLSLVWFYGYHGLPGGWAGYDICTTGIPQLFWDFGSPGNSRYDCFPMFNDTQSFVDKSFELLNNAEKACQLGRDQFEFVAKYQDIKKYICNLERAFIKAAQK